MWQKSSLGFTGLKRYRAILFVACFLSFSFLFLSSESSQLSSTQSAQASPINQPAPLAMPEIQPLPSQPEPQLDNSQPLVQRLTQTLEAWITWSKAVSTWYQALVDSWTSLKSSLTKQNEAWKGLFDAKDAQIAQLTLERDQARASLATDEAQLVKMRAQAWPDVLTGLLGGFLGGFFTGHFVK